MRTQQGISADDVPAGCSCRDYPKVGATGVGFFEAKLPGDMNYGGQHATRRSYRPGLRSADAAREECLLFLRSAINARAR